MKVASVVKRITFLIMTMALAVAMVACQGAVGKPGEPGKTGDPGDPAPKQAPFVTAKFAPETDLAEDDSEPTLVVVSGHFHDPEVQVLTYTAAVTPPGIVEIPDELAANEAGDFVLTITPLARGPATITVTATDPDGMSISETIVVTVRPEGIKPPEYLVGSLPESILLVLEDGDYTSTIEGAKIKDSFVEPEGENLTYDPSVEPVDNSIVSLIEEADSTVTIVAVAVGKATVTITATDEDNETAMHKIAVVVVQSAKPVAVGEIPPQSVIVGKAKAVNVAGYFLDPLDDDLTYTPPVSSDMNVATAVVVGSFVTITPVGAGEATVTITATNSRGLSSANQEITVTVNASEPKIPDPPKSIRDFEPVSFAYDDPVVHTFELSDYFTGAISYYTADSDNEAVAISTEDEGVLSITPGLDRDGRANVTVTAINDGGSSPQKNIVVDVLPKPNKRPTVKEPIKDVRLVKYTIVTNEGPAKTPSESKWVVTDLNDYFTDPENSPLTFKVVIASQEPAGVVMIRTEPSGFEKAAQVDGTAVGTATIKVTAIDNSGKKKDQTFEITVVGSNEVPTALRVKLDGYTGAERLKLSGISKKPINDKKVATYFKDENLGAVANNDRLTFTAEYVLTNKGKIEFDVLSVDEKNKIKEGDAVATAEISPNTWDGGANDKFTVTVTPKKAGDAAHDILIVATDLGGRQGFIRIPVQVNQPPVAVGPEKTDPKKLSEYKDAETLSGGANDIVLKLTDYFHDDDSGDKLTCSATPSVTDKTAPAVVTMNTINNELTLAIRAYDIDFVPMTVTVFCTDDFKEASPTQTFSVAVTSA